MTDKIHIQGRISEMPVSERNSGYTFFVIPYNSDEPVKVVVRNGMGLTKGYRSGDKVIVSGTSVTAKIIEDGFVRCRKIVRAENIILMPQREGT